MNTYFKQISIEQVTKWYTIGSRSQKPSLGQQQNDTFGSPSKFEHFQNRDERKDKDGKNKVVQTLTQYSNSSSLHGIQYVFEGGKNLLASRVIWIVIVLAAAAIGILLSIQVRHLNQTQTFDMFYPNALL